MRRRRRHLHRKENAQGRKPFSILSLLSLSVRFQLTVREALEREGRDSGGFVFFSPRAHLLNWQGLCVVGGESTFTSIRSEEGGERVGRLPCVLGDEGGFVSRTGVSASLYQRRGNGARGRRTTWLSL